MMTNINLDYIRVSKTNDIVITKEAKILDSILRVNKISGIFEYPLPSSKYKYEYHYDRRFFAEIIVGDDTTMIIPLIDHDLKEELDYYSSIDLTVESEMIEMDKSTHIDTDAHTLNTILCRNGTESLTFDLHKGVIKYNTAYFEMVDGELMLKKELPLINKLEVA